MSDCRFEMQWPNYAFERFGLLRPSAFLRRVDRGTRSIIDRA
jgi:hypothetical protein